MEILRNRRRNKTELQLHRQRRKTYKYTKKITSANGYEALAWTAVVFFTISLFMAFAIFGCAGQNERPCCGCCGGRKREQRIVVTGTGAPQPQAYPTQGYPAQPQGYPNQGYPGQGGHPLQGYPPQSYQQQGYPAQGYPQGQGYQSMGRTPAAEPVKDPAQT